MSSEIKPFKVWAVTGCDGKPITGYLSEEEPNVPNKARLVIRTLADDKARDAEIRELKEFRRRALILARDVVAEANDETSVDYERYFDVVRQAKALIATAEKAEREEI